MAHTEQKRRSQTNGQFAIAMQDTTAVQYVTVHEITVKIIPRMGRRLKNVYTIYPRLRKWV